MEFDLHRRRSLAALATLGSMGAWHGLLRARPGIRIAVVGAGAAGVAAADTLTRAGADVVVLEARSRIGGRIWTSDALGVPVDLGAAWIHGERGNPMIALARAAGVPLRATDWEATQLYDCDGARFSEDISEQAWAMAERAMADLARSAKRAAPDAQMAAAVEALRGGLLASLAPQPMRAVEWMLHTEIESESGASYAERSHAAYDSEQALAGDDLLLQRGYRALIAPIAASLDVRLGSPVTAVRHDAAAVELTVEQGAVIHADAAILTVPLGVLKANVLGIEPALPERQQTAIERLGMGVLDKLVLRFPERFWPAGDAPFGVVAPPALADAGLEVYPLDGLLGAPLLVLLYGGPRARRLAALGGQAEQVADAMARLRAAFPDAPDPNAVQVTHWAADPWSRGSYSVMAPGSSLAGYRALAQPAGKRLWLADEATVDDFPATVHGAWRSGQRAAREVLAALGA